MTTDEMKDRLLQATRTGWVLKWSDRMADLVSSVIDTSAINWFQSPQAVANDIVGEAIRMNKVEALRTKLGLKG